MAFSKEITLSKNMFLSFYGVVDVFPMKIYKITESFGLDLSKLSHGLVYKEENWDGEIYKVAIKPVQNWLNAEVHVALTYYF